MKTYQALLAAFCFVFTLFGCNQVDDEKSGRASLSDSSVNIISSLAAVENGRDSTRKFIRTADLKFKVRSVIKSTYDIEDIVSRHGGFVTFTDLTSATDNVTRVAISADSSLETTYYTSTNTMTLRVPNKLLDTMLKEISRNIQYLDYRIIKADDVAINILANSLLQARSISGEKRIEHAIDSRGKKLNETTIAEETLQAKKEQADAAKIANLSLADQVNFSTIKLNIYERQAVARELVSNEKTVEQYEQGFGRKILEALKYGWDTLAAFVIFLTRLWGFLLMAVLIFLSYKIYRTRMK